MKTKVRKLARLFGSTWVFAFTLLIFVAESGWLAFTSRFPMAYDEAYHFSLIQFFGHRIDPIVTSQSAGTYKLGALIQNSSFLYHYLMSLPYRLIAFFTSSLEVQVIGLRLINIALAVVSLIVMRKLLRLISVSDSQANVIMLAFALTPIMAVLSAQINYDNLLILAVSLCVYETVAFIKWLDEGFLDTKRLLVLLCLCLFSSLIKFAFLPVFLVLSGLVIWKVGARWHAGHAKLMAGAKSSFYGIGRYTRLALIVTAISGSLLFTRVYIVNLIKYHDPAPQCDKVLSVKDCEHYYAWNNIHATQSYDKTHHIVGSAGVLRYSAYWFMANTFELFGAIVPLTGHLYAYQPYFMIIALLGTAAFICMAVNLKKMLKQNQDLMILAAVSLVYILFLLAKNYHDYMQVGQPIAIHGRYLMPVLIYMYILLASGVSYALGSARLPSLAVKTGLALTVVLSFLYYGGFRQYVSYVDPVYGPMSPSNNFTLDDAAQK